VFGYVTAARLFAALSTFQVVGGIDDLASWTGIVLPNFLEPFSVADRLDSCKIDPQLDPVRHCRLKLSQVIAGILFTLAAKIDASFSCASEHLAFLAIGQPLVRTASIALALILRKMQLCRKPFEPFRIFSGGNKPRARLTVKATYSSKFLVQFFRVIFFLLHDDFYPHLLINVIFSSLHNVKDEPRSQLARSLRQQDA
jgi:hypothetical protein